MKNYLLIIICSLHLAPMIAFGQDTGNSKILWDAAWSPDGKYIAVGGDNHQLLIYDGQNFNLLKRYEIGSGIQRLEWHPHKHLVAVAAAGDHSRLIHIETGNIIPLKETGEGTRSIAWNHDGKLLAAANYDKSISIWNADGILVQTTPNMSSKSFLGIDWHPLKNELITLSDSIRIFDLDGKLLKKFKHRADDVIPLCIKWHSSGKFFVTGDYGYDNYPSTLHFWRDDSLIYVNTISKAEFRNIDWSKDGRYLATASDALRIWSKEGKLLSTGFSEDKLWGISWSSDGKYIVTSGFDGLIKIWSDKAILVRQLTY